MDDKTAFVQWQTDNQAVIESYIKLDQHPWSTMNVKELETVLGI